MPRIVPHPHPALRYTSRPLDQIDDALRATVRVMFDLMYEARGIGLAANQVALPFRFFVMNLTADREQPDQELVFINPVIVKRHSSLEDEEGCLSIPGLYSNVRRARKVRVKAFDLAGKDVDLEADDLLARAVQHEIDHLDGKLFIDYLGPVARLSAGKKLRAFETKFREAQAAGLYPQDDALVRRLDALTTPSLDEAQPEPVPVVAPPPEIAAEKPAAG